MSYAVLARERKSTPIAKTTSLSQMGCGTDLQRKCSCGSGVKEGECKECNEKEVAMQRKSDGGTGPSLAPRIVHEVLRSPGQMLDQPTRRYMEPRFGHDFGNVRVHTDPKAAESARAVNALAYTVGSDVVFGTGQFSTGTDRGRKLIAHELAHTVQQGAGVPGPKLTIGDSATAAEDAAQNASKVVSESGAVAGLDTAHQHVARQPQAGGAAPAAGATPKTGPAPDFFEESIKEIRAMPAYRALDAAHVAVAENIITELRKRSNAEQLHFLSKLKLLFNTPVNPPSTVTATTQAGTTQAANEEKTRLTKPAEAKNVPIEEKATSDPARAGSWVPIKGKFGGGTYYVSRKSPTDIVVKAEIMLTPKGTGTKADVDSIKGMEDAIEKAASTAGYVVDIRFVDHAGPDTFQVDVDPSSWETATNWSGGRPWGFAHELHHLFAFELDRYDYIEAHAANTSMKVPDRLTWFLKELHKPANFNDPNSIMNRAAHPDDDDACQVAGLNVATCVPARQAARAAGKL
jgi:hypothetical protein